MKKWRHAHPEYQRVYNVEYYKANKERANELGRKWRLANLHVEKATNKKWQENNRDKVTARSGRHRSAKLRAIPAWANHFFISEAYHLAALRTKMLGYPWHVDHIVPLQSKLVCGLHVEHNLQVIPSVANQRKNNRHWPDMP